MKQESLKAIREMADYVTRCDEIPEGRKQYMLDELTRIIRIEDDGKEKDSKFNWYNYASKDEIRPAINGIYHDNGFKVATDTHILALRKEEYNPEYEGKILAKDGHFIDGRFPNYRAVFYDVHRKDENGNPYTYDGEPYREYPFDFKKLKELKKQADAEVKMRGGKQFKDKILARIGNVYLRFYHLVLLADFMRECGMTTVWACSSSRAIETFNGEDAGLLMPWRINEEHNSELPQDDENKVMIFHFIESWQALN